MTTPSINHAVLTDPSWWHWAFTIPLLGLHVRGVPWALWAAIGLCIVIRSVLFLARSKVAALPSSTAYCIPGAATCWTLSGVGMGPLGTACWHDGHGQRWLLSARENP